jgi:nitroreductase
MDIESAITGRRAVREYASEAVSEDTIRQLIGAAVMAPSAVNVQPWTFTVVRDQGLLDRLSARAKSYMLETLPPGPHAQHLRLHLGAEGFQIFYHAPVLIVIAGSEAGPWVVEDCAMAAQNLMLSAYGRGLGSCWIGFAQTFLNTPEGKGMVGIPSAWVPVAPIIVGKPKAPPPPVPRKEPVIRWVA